MNMDPGVLDMIAKFVGVNVGVTLLMAVMSYGLSAVLLNGLEAMDRRLDPSRKRRG